MLRAWEPNSWCGTADWGRIRDDCLALEDFAHDPGPAVPPAVAAKAKAEAGTSGAPAGDGEGAELERPTFWLAAGNDTEGHLEALARAVQRLHAPSFCSPPDAVFGAVVGVEWWDQVSLSPRSNPPRSRPEVGGGAAAGAALGAALALETAGCFSPGSQGFHVDKDEDLFARCGAVRHPALWTVTYLSNGLAPTVVLDRALGCPPERPGSFSISTMLAAVAVACFPARRSALSCRMPSSARRPRAGLASGGTRHSAAACCTECPPRRHSGLTPPLLREPPLLESTPPRTGGQRLARNAWEARRAGTGPSPVQCA